MKILDSKEVYVQPEPEEPVEGAAQPDVIGRIKAGLLSPLGGGDIPRDVTGAPAGDVRDPGFLRQSVGAIGNALIPGSWEELAIQGAMAIPGSGLGATALRTGAAVGAPMAIAGMKGEDPLAAGMQAVPAALTGAVLGGVTRMATRMVAKEISADVPRLAKVMADIAPEYAGGTPRATIARVVSGEGQAAVRAHFGQAERAALQGLGPVRVPSLEKLDVPSRLKRGAMGFYEPMAANRALKDIRSALFDADGNFRSTGRGTFRERYLLEQAEREFNAQLPPSVARNLQQIRGEYARAMEVARVIGGGKTRVTRGRLEELVPDPNAAEGLVDFPALQQSYQTQRGRLARVLTPRQLNDFDRAMRYEPLMRDVEGALPHVGISSYGGIPHPYAHGSWRGATRSGGSERAAGIAAGIGRQVGARAPYMVGGGGDQE